MSYTTLSFGDKVRIRHPIERLNGLIGTFIGKRRCGLKTLYEVKVRDRVYYLDRIQIVSSQYDGDEPGNLQELYEVTGWIPQIMTNLELILLKSKQ